MLAIQEKKTAAILLSLDLLAKLFEYGYWNLAVPGMPGLIGLITETICNCFSLGGGATDEKIQTQVLRVLVFLLTIGFGCCDLH